MKVLSKKEGGFYNNKLLVVSVLMLILIGVLWFVYADAINSPRVTFNSPSLNNTFVSDFTPSINITFTAIHSAYANVTILNSSINVTIIDVDTSVVLFFYNFSDLTCVYSPDPAKVNESITCNVTTQPLANGTYNITAAAMDNASGTITATLQNYTIYTDAPSIYSVVMSDPSPTKAGNVSFNITFNRMMNTSLAPVVKLRLANGAEIGIAGVGTGYNSTYGMTTLHNRSFTNDTSVNRRSMWSGHFVFNTSAETSSIFDGNTTINVTNAEDILGNDLLNATYIFTLDTTNPWVQLSTPNGTNQSTLSLSFNFTDNLSSIAHCTLYLNDTLNNTDASVANDTLTSINISDPSQEGAFQWIVECNDTANNRANATTLGQMVYVDRTAPVMQEARNSPLDGHYVNTSTLSIIANITDAFTGIKNSTTTLTMAIYIDGKLTQTYKADGSELFNLYLYGAKSNYLLNISDYHDYTTFSSGEEVSVIVTAVDYAGNINTSNTTFYIDNTKPLIGTPTLNGSTYTQGDNLTFSVVITETGAGLNKSTAGFTINNTDTTTISSVDLTCTGNKSIDYTCTFNYNTSALQAGSLRLTGSINASDNTDELKNNATIPVIWDFIINDSGRPTLESITSNVTRIVKNISADVRINVSVNDTGGINTVWATYNDNGTPETCTFFSGGGVGDTSLVAIGNCTINATTASSDVSSDNVLTLTLRANDTTGTLATTSTYNIIVENEVINVTAFTAPLKPYVNQTITINTTVFSWYGKPSLWFNATMGNDSLSDYSMRLNATCITADAKASLYYCANTTNTSFFGVKIGNQSIISIINATYSYIANDTTLPTELIATFYASKTVTLDKVPSTSTIKLVGSDVKVTGGTTITGSNATQNIQITDTTLNGTIITLNQIKIDTITNFTFEIVAANSSGGTGAGNGTNSSIIGPLLLASQPRTTLLTSMVIQPMINNVSTSDIFEGSTIAFNCTTLGITCDRDTRAYRASFNMTTNSTSSGWTRIIGVEWSRPILTVTTDRFSIFALASYTAPAAEEEAPAPAPTGGGTSGGIGYLLAGKLTAFDIIDMIKDFYAGISTYTAFEIIDKIKEFYEGGT